MIKNSRPRLQRVVRLAALSVLLLGNTALADPDDGVARNMGLGQWHAAQTTLLSLDSLSNLDSLRLGVCAAYLGNHNQADKYLRASTGWRLAPYVRYWRAMAAVGSGQSDLAIRLLSQVGSSTTMAFRDSVALLQARSYLMSGDTTHAISSYESVALRPGRTGASAAYSVVRLKWTMGDSSWSSQIASMISKHSNLPVTRNAVAYAQARGYEPGGDQATDMARYSRGQGRHGEAGRWYARALSTTSDSGAKMRLHLKAGAARLRARHYRVAKTHYMVVVDSAASPELIAKGIRGMAALERKRLRPELARSWEYRFLSRYPDHQKAPDAWWQIAWGWARVRNWTKAADAFKSLADQYPDFENADAARWRMGFCLYRSSDVQGAYDTFTNLASSGTDYVAVDQGAYWASKLAGELGLEEQRIRWLKLAASTAPRSYYSLKAAATLGTPYTASPSNVRQPVTHAFPQTATARTLASCGARGWARALLERSHVPATGDYRTMDRLAVSYDAIGDYARAMRWGSNGAWRVKGPGSFHELEVHRLKRTYPAYFVDGVRLGAQSHNIDPALIWGVIRQESVFDPLSLSAAHARGLMQIIPATGRALAKDDGITGFQTVDLYDPTINIRLGSTYLAKLLRRFGGRMEPVLAAYNAGPRQARRWWRISDDIDVVIESITYRETRKYVKLVMRNYWIYRGLYPELSRQ